MTVLTQQIMQQALINRKLEEQKENYRRRQGEVRQVGQTACLLSLPRHLLWEDPLRTGGGPVS